MSTPSEHTHLPAVYPDGSKLRIAVIAAKWHHEIVDKMLLGATETLEQCHVQQKNINVIRCSGAYEIPVIASTIAAGRKADAIVCLGVIIRGETPHFDFVAGPVADQLQRIAVDNFTPCIFGVLTTDDAEQAHNRAGGSHGNKGVDCAIAAVETALAVKSVH